MATFYFLSLVKLSDYGRGGPEIVVGEMRSARWVSMLIHPFCFLLLALSS